MSPLRISLLFPLNPLKTMKELEFLEKALLKLDSEFRTYTAEYLFSEECTIGDINEYLAIDDNLIEVISRLRKLIKSKCPVVEK